MEVSYQYLLEMLHDKDKGNFDRQFQKAKKYGTEIDLEYRVLKPNQSTVNVHVRAVPKKDKDGKVIRIIGVLYDISSMVLTENRLKESEEKFETIVNNLDIGIWSFDAVKNQISYVSPAVEKITGYTRKSYLLGKKEWTDVIHPDNNEDLTIVQSIILLAKGFKSKIVAEEVETHEQWDLLRKLDCHCIQGFLFSKPMPVEEFGKLLLSNAGERVYLNP